MESTNAKQSESRRLRFDLRTIIAVVLLISVMVGVAAAIDSLAFLAGESYFDYHNRAWELRQSLLNSGVSVQFVTHYYTIAYPCFPGWLCLALIAFALGLGRSRLLHMAAVVLALTTVLSQMYSRFVGTPSFLGMSNLYIICFLGGVIVFMSWLLGSGIRGRYAQVEGPVENNFSRIVLPITLFACMLPLSLFGWWTLEIARSVNESF